MLSDRVLQSAESITLKLNARAEELRKNGNKVYNFTAGQLPYKPSQKMIDCIQKNLNFLKSYQYAPVPGLLELREKVLSYIQETRGITLSEDTDCVVSTGAKQSIYNLMGALVNPGDEVVILAPYWVSYPAIINYWQGKSKVVESVHGASKGPSVAAIDEAITDKTKAIVINSPGNPSGVYFDESWMHELSTVLKKYPNLQIISDEIYYELNYYDPKPKYVYHFEPELLDRTFIIDGISKSMACTGLRVGYAIGNATTLKGMSKIQGQSTSGANSLMQRALVDYDFSDISAYLAPVKDHLRSNSEILQSLLDKNGLESAWYQTNSAFYFFIDFSQMPILDKFKKSQDDTTDYGFEICEQLISEKGVVIVPGTDFGVSNSARMSLVLEKDLFTEGLTKMLELLTCV